MPAERPAVAQNVPGAQRVLEASPEEPQKEPAGHCMLAVNPLIGQYELIGQAGAAERPAEEQKVPAGQLTGRANDA